MKIRTGFVSNSSSTSFTCVFCGTTKVYHDSQSHRDYGFVLCENDHSLCEKHLDKDWKEISKNYFIKKEPVRQDYEHINDFKKAYEEWKECYDYDIPLEVCPMCQMKIFLENDLYRYLLKISEKTKKDIEEEIRTRFINYEDFNNFLNNK